MSPTAAILTAFLLAQEPARAPEPSPERQKESLKLVRELYKDEYARRSPADQAVLAGKLLESGVGTTDDEAARFVLLKEALDVASGCAQIAVVVAAADALGRGYAVDGPALKLAALQKTAPLVRDPGALSDLAAGFVGCAQQAIADDAFDTAATALARAEAVARAARDASGTARVQELKRELPELRQEHKRAAAGDPEASGRYLCFAKGDWTRGLPLLAKAKGPIGELAQKDLSGPAGAEERAQVGEAWLDVAKKERSAWRKARIADRARVWLEGAVPELGGLGRVRAQKRLEEVESVLPGYVDLLRLVDPRKDAVQGSWALQEGRLVSDDARFTRVEIPYRPPAEYDLRVVFARIGGENDVNLLLTHKGRAFVCILGGGGYTVGLGNCRDAWVDKPGNPTVTRLQEPFKPGVAVTALVEVRRDGVRVLLDGAPVLTWKTDYADLTPASGWTLRDAALLGLGTYMSPTAFHRITLIEVSGPGSKAR